MKTYISVFHVNFCHNVKYTYVKHFSTRINRKYVPTYPTPSSRIYLVPLQTCCFLSFCFVVYSDCNTNREGIRETTGRERDWGEAISVLTHAAPNPTPPPLPGMNPLLDSLITSPQLTGAGREMYSIIWLIHTRVTDFYTSIIGLTYGDLDVACQFTPLRLFTLSASRPYMCIPLAMHRMTFCPSHSLYSYWGDRLWY